MKRDKNFKRRHREYFVVLWERPKQTGVTCQDWKDKEMNFLKVFLRCSHRRSSMYTGLERNQN